MAANIICPVCEHKHAIPETMVGRKVTCPSCESPFVAQLSPASYPKPEISPPPAAASPGYSSPPVQAPPPSRTVLAEPEEQIRYKCPGCKKSLESPASMGGQKLNCPECGQRLQIPFPKAPVNKTVMAIDEGQLSSPPPPPPFMASGPKPPAGQPATDGPIVAEVLPESAPPREHCLECGRNITGRERVLTCPDCGSLFCSSGCFRDHREYSHETRRRRKRRRQWREGFHCPFCGTDEPPYRVEDISAGGWVVFAVMLVVCFPLFWIGLLIKEEYRTCAGCGMRLG